MENKTNEDKKNIGKTQQKEKTKIVKSKRLISLKEFCAGKNIRREVLAAIKIKEIGNYKTNEEWQKILKEYSER